MLFPKLFPLRIWVLPIEFDVFMADIQLFREVGLYTFIGSNDHGGSTIHLQKLRKNKAGRPCADYENFYPNFRIEVVQSAYGASCRLDEGCFFVGEIVDPVDLL